MNGTKRNGPRAKGILGNGRGHANLAAGTRSTQQTTLIADGSQGRKKQ
jgi:hypothetical protein